MASDKAPVDVYCMIPVSETNLGNLNADATSATLQEKRATALTNASKSDGSVTNNQGILQTAEPKLSFSTDKLSQHIDSEVKANSDTVEEVTEKKSNQSKDASTTLGGGTPKQSPPEHATPKRLTLSRPKRPDGLPSDIADTIASGKFYEAWKSRKENPSLPEGSLVEFLLLLGGATPIPDTLISDHLVQTMDTESFRIKLRSFIGTEVAASDARGVSSKFYSP